MKITTLIAAGAIATASTAAVADTTAVTTDSGEVVMIEKNQDSAALLAALGPAAFALLIAILAANSGTGTN